MTKAYLGIDIGSISTKGVVIDENRTIIARSYLWTEGNPTEASKNVVRELEAQLAEAGDDFQIVGAGTTGSARRLVGAMLGASVIKNEITAHAVGTTYLHPDVRTILEIGGQDSKIICVSDGIAVDYASPGRGCGVVRGRGPHLEEAGEHRRPLHRVRRERPGAQDPGGLRP